jgi:hypothetical protein
VALPHISSQPLAYLYLSQIPYTGLELGPLGTVFYWLAFTGFVLALTYLMLFGVVPSVYRWAHLFGSRISTSLNVQGRSSTATSGMTTVSAAPSIVETSPQAMPGYSTYEGFKSFTRNGALSVEDIVKGLSRKNLALAAERIVEPKPHIEPVYENVEPIVAAGAIVESTAIPTHIRILIDALVEGDRGEVFAGLRQHVRNGGTPEKLFSTMVCILDDVYHARMDGTTCDADIVRLTARLSTPILEKLIASLTTAIDSSYSDGVTGAKLALIRALTVLGA